ncbi:hypothetical protein Ciccas_011412 [Cichlidogyrus casuarinus]|uniref:MOFRL-associated domain-containing protein n=1 Tax=Cichlidogyrus casuarinus TaxID=1844966 RepID=A0ABD2PRA1_9PLAT
MILELAKGILESVRADVLIQNRVAVDGQTIRVKTTEDLRIEIKKPVHVIAVGKAAQHMAKLVKTSYNHFSRAMVDILSPSNVHCVYINGMPNTELKHRIPIDNLHVTHGSLSNKPNLDIIRGTRRICDHIKEIDSMTNKPNDELIVLLLSGGGSSLFCLPREVERNLNLTLSLTEGRGTG